MLLRIIPVNVKFGKFMNGASVRYVISARNEISKLEVLNYSLNGALSSILVLVHHLYH